jgi:3-oxoacyl-[acyl-carrier protein] reductase
MNTALVTGATRGIGRAVVLALLSAGRRVVAVGRDATALSALERAHPGRVVGLAIDLSQPRAAAFAVDEAERVVGPLDELVYAAGIVEYAPALEAGEAALRRQLELNFIAPFTMVQRAGQRMTARGQGAIVAVASTLAFAVAPGTAAYAASKAALVNAMRTFALELAPHVRVNVVAPGVVDTEMVRVPRKPLRADENREEAIEAELVALRALHPLQRLGSADEVAEAVLYLLAARWVTGTVLTVDGGLTLR